MLTARQSVRYMHDLEIAVPAGDAAGRLNGSKVITVKEHDPQPLCLIWRSAPSPVKTSTTWGWDAVLPEMVGLEI